MTPNSRNGTLKYLPPSEVCPTKKLMGKMKGFQEEENFAEPTLFEGVVITEPGGYCAMWSLYFLDLRLKTMKQPVQKIYELMATELDKEYKKSGSTYIELMRGVSKYGWEKMKILTTPKYMVGYTKEDLIRYLAGESGKGSTKTDGGKNVEKAVLKLTSDLQMALSDKYGKRKLIFNNTIRTKFDFKLNPTTDPLSQNINKYVGSGAVSQQNNKGGTNMLVNLKTIWRTLYNDYDYKSSLVGSDQLDFKDWSNISSKFVDWDNKPINKIPKKDRTYMKNVLNKYIAWRDEDAEGSMVDNMPDKEVKAFFDKYF
tara:strand:+ start:8 stop:946 length:939 start_codon:yes stop_codon:yes gene_type:complete